MLKEQIAFKYYKPIFYFILNVISVIALGVCCYFSLSYLAFPQAVGVIFIGFIFWTIVLFFGEKKLYDLKCVFVFYNNEFSISSIFINRTILYSDILSITREYYEEQKSMGIVSYTQLNPRQFRISLRDRSEISFRIAKKEEQKYLKAIGKLERKIYKKNRLGIYLTSSLETDEAILKQRDEQFKNEKPNCNYSLEKAINKLVIRSDIKLNDLTI